MVRWRRQGEQCVHHGAQGLWVGVVAIVDQRRAANLENLRRACPARYSVFQRGSAFFQRNPARQARPRSPASALRDIVLAQQTQLALSRADLPATTVKLVPSAPIGVIDSARGSAQAPVPIVNRLASKISTKLLRHTGRRNSGSRYQAAAEMRSIHTSRGQSQPGRRENFRHGPCPRSSPRPSPARRFCTARQSLRRATCPFQGSRLHVPAAAAITAAASRNDCSNFPRIYARESDVSSTCAMASLVVVFPALPVMPITRLPQCRRTEEASRCMAASGSSTRRSLRIPSLFVRRTIACDRAITAATAPRFRSLTRQNRVHQIARHGRQRKGRHAESCASRWNIRCACWSPTMRERIPGRLRSHPFTNLFKAQLHRASFLSRLDSPYRSSNACRASSASSNGIVRSRRICTFSWPLPAITTTSFSRASAMAVNRAGPDLVPPGTSNSAGLQTRKNFLKDCIGILGAGIVAGGHDKVASLYRPHDPC